MSYFRSLNVSLEAFLYDVGFVVEIPLSFLLVHGEPNTIDMRRSGGILQIIHNLVTIEVY